MSGIPRKLAHELRALIPVTLFFLVAFSLLALTQMLLLAEHGIRVSTFAAAALGALIVAKVVVIADHFRWVDRFPGKPLIYNVVWKSAIYFFASLGVRYAEHLVRFWRRTGSFTEANAQLIEEIVWPHFWGVQVWLLVLLLVYCSFRELARAIGRERIVEMFFKEPQIPGGDRPTAADRPLRA